MIGIEDSGGKKWIARTNPADIFFKLEANTIDTTDSLSLQNLFDIKLYITKFYTINNMAVNIV